MTRAATSLFLAELAAGTVRPVVFYEGEFAAGTVRLWTGVGQRDWNGQTWLGFGALLGVSNVTETGDLRAEGITVSLSGIDATVVALVRDQARLGLAGRIWFGFLTAADAIMADPYLCFEGKLDVPTITADGNGTTVSIAYENHLRDLERARVFRWTHETQKKLYPGSFGFQYAAQQQDVTVVF